ncbi:protein arginine N-methyltransferase 7 [Uranotaenia lowii]|uniref:protein arginine N-methyltransferase 7 n=1 Tax=Uranotaenia lowii TaxID=190385 RepID=UPI00247AE0C2|nr:protein arginine N-methyltransferase 7 [Uranotaenia lowii]
MDLNSSNFSDEEYDPDSAGECFDRQQEIARSAFADMCHDTERNQKYDQLLKVTIQRLHANGKQAHVLDIGTGSGLLSMMAVRAGADSVTACEAFRPMADCAERIIAANGMADRIRLVKKRSTSMQVGPDKDMERKANVLVTELFDTELIGEGAIATYQHAWLHLLEPGSPAIPHSASVYVQIVECPLAMSWQTPRDLFNCDGDLLLKTPRDVIECRGSSAVFDLQLSQLPLRSFRELSKPVEVFYFDWSGRIPLERKRHLRKSVTLEGNGVAHAVFMWWELHMGDSEIIKLSCAPYWSHPDYVNLEARNTNLVLPKRNLIPWRDHWMQAIYFLPKQPSPLLMGQTVMLDAYHDEFSLWFGIDQPNLPQPHCSCGMHIAYSRSRIGQLNEDLRNKQILMYLEEHLDTNSAVLVLGEGSVLGLAIATLGVAKVILLESSSTSRQCMENYMANNQIKHAQIVSQLDQIELAEITHVFAEPFFNSAILPWENGLKYKTLVDSLKPRLRDDVKIIPEAFSILAIPVEFLDLHKINAALGTCEGFDLSLMDQLIEDHSTVTDTMVEAQPLWEYPCFALGKPATLITIPLNVSFPEDIKRAKGQMKVLRQGVLSRCNGIAVWAEWFLGRSGGYETTISTGLQTPIDADNVLSPHPQPLNWNFNCRQGVQLVKETVRDEISWSVEYNSTTGSCSFQFDV